MTIMEYGISLPYILAFVFEKKMCVTGLGQCR